MSHAAFELTDVCAHDRGGATDTHSGASRHFGGIIVGVSDEHEPTPHRDLAAYDARAVSYDDGWRGRMHHRISERVCALAAATAPDARRILDVGCGTGYLLRALGQAFPNASELMGVDPAGDMIRVAGESTVDDRIRFSVASAESLPSAGAFDLIVSSTSFDHWRDQRAGLQECARALVPGGHLVLCDQFSALLAPTLVGTRRGKARTPSRATTLARDAGFVDVRWHPVYLVLINALTARKP